MNHRLHYIDLLKAFAVLLVIVGHVISNYDEALYRHPVNVWIYSFHMALFMMLSGMFFSHTFNKSFKEVITQKAIQLLLPLCSWSIVHLVVYGLLTSSIGEWGHIISDYVRAGGPLHGLWFLKCLFLYFVVCHAAMKILKNEWAAAIVTIALFVALPDMNFSRQMIVFFWTGHFIQKICNILIANRRLLLGLTIGGVSLCYLFSGFVGNLNISTSIRIKKWSDSCCFGLWASRLRSFGWGALCCSLAVGTYVGR